MRVKKSGRRDQSSFGVIDYALMAVGNCLAAFTAGMAVGQAEIAWFFVYAITAGTIFSLIVRKLAGQTRFVRIDSVLYGAAALTAVAMTPRLNSVLPGEGIPADVLTAGWLCWMLTFGSALTWRDRTLLFQAVPTIALFGLVGCYDTYKPAPFLFFGFLLCLATLLGRSNSREMLRQAVESGYFNRADAPNAPSEHPEQSPELFEDIKRGPWRWLAGPEWALMSGLAIVVVSLVGAPVIHEAVQPLSGVIQVHTPKTRGNNFNPTPATAIPGTTYQVGRGPLFDLRGKPQPIFSASLDKMRYLRVSTFDVYDGHGWRSSYIQSIAENTDSPDYAASTEMKQPQSYKVTIRPLTSAPTLPLPIETVTASAPPGCQVMIRQDGGGESIQTREEKIVIDGQEAGVQPVTAQRNIPAIMLPDLQTDNLPLSVRTFAIGAMKGAKTDYEKAIAIQEAIAARCDYSLSASAVPPDSDACDFFLNNSRVGYCDLFATAMTMCARVAGIPARYALGYLPDPSNHDLEGNTVIEDRDYHAWAELYFKDVGWVVFDATAGAEVRDTQAGALSRVWWSGEIGQIFNALIACTLVILAGVWVWPKLKRNTSRKSPRNEVEKEYISFTRGLARLVRRTRMPSETPHEYMAALKPLLRTSLEAAERLNDRFVAALFSPVPVTEGTAAELRADVRSFIKQAKRSERRS